MTHSNILYRKIIPKIKNDLEHHKIQVLIGSRQVGKTSILRYLQNELTNVIYLDMDRLFDVSMFESADAFLRYIRAHQQKPGENVTVFVDEFQQIPESGKIFKVIHDHYPDIRLILSGSSSLNIMKNLGESMAGRKRVYEIYPLDFEEHLHFIGHTYYDFFKTAENFDYLPEIFPELKHVFEMFLRHGGYPAVSLLNDSEEKIEELNDIVKSYIDKDIKAFFNIDNLLIYNKLLRRLSLNIGNLLNLQSVSADVGLKQRNLAHYLYLLMNTFIIDLLPPFYRNKINELKKMTKLYFWDTGIRNFLIANFQALPLRTDMGALVENGVWSELRKNKSQLTEIKFWRTTGKSEIDFIILYEGEIIPVEVKYQKQVKTIPRTVKSFINSYACRRAYVLTQSQTFELTYQNATVSFLPAFFSGKIPGQLAQKQ